MIDKKEDFDDDSAEDEEFLRTGSFSISFKVDLEITEEDMIRDLVGKTEGKMIEPDLPKEHNNN